MVSLNPSRRYWLSMAGIVLGTLLVAGLAGGAMAVRLGPGSLVSSTYSDRKSVCRERV